MDAHTLISRKRKADALSQDNHDGEPADGTSDPSNKQCGICLSSVETEGILGCAHSFCFECIMQWGQITNRCPLCRRRFSSISTVETRIEDGEEVEIVTEVMVEECDSSSTSASDSDVYGHMFDPLDEESEEEDDSSTDYDDDSGSDSDDEWILSNPRPTQDERTSEDASFDEPDTTPHRRRRHATSPARRRFPCEQCGKVFKTSSDRNRHLLIHTQVKKFVCDQCGKRFTRKQDLQRHLVSHASEPTTTTTTTTTSPSGSSDDEVSRVCTTSSSTLSSSRAGEVGSEAEPTSTSSSSSATPRRFVCEFPGCGKSYTLPNNLSRHRRGAHKGVSSPPSSSSGGSSGSLVQATSPTPSSPSPSSPPPSPPATPQRFVCDHAGCGKSFSLRNNLARHRKAHKGPAHPCSVCDRSFTQASDLRRHMAIHSDVRAFACNLCSQTFRQKAHLAAHLRSKVHDSSASSSS